MRGAGGSLRDNERSFRETGGSFRDNGKSLRENSSLRETGGSLRETGGSLRETGGSLRETGGSVRDNGSSLRNSGGTALNSFDKRNIEVRALVFKKYSLIVKLKPNFYCLFCDTFKLCNLKPKLDFYVHYNLRSGLKRILRQMCSPTLTKTTLQQQR